MTQGVSDFEQQLGRELRAAARRRIESRHERAAASRRRRVGLAVAAAGFVAVAALAVFALLRPDAAVADPFRVIYLADEVHLEIIDLVRDPSAAERDLHAELNIAVELVALPAPPELVGHVVGAASTGTTTAYVVYDLAGRSERIVMPREIDGTLIIQYGRRARADERYEVNVTSPVCEELWEMSPHQALRRLADLADHIRYDTIDSDYDYTSNVAPAAVDPDYQLIDVVFLSGNELLVVYSAHLDALGTDRPNCGWSAAATASR